MLKQKGYSDLISSISHLLEASKKRVVQQVNTVLIETYRNIGKYITHYQQQQKDDITPGNQLLKQIAKDLKDKFGKEFSRRNIYYMRLFYQYYPKLQTLSAKNSKL